MDEQVLRTDHWPPVMSAPDEGAAPASAKYIRLTLSSPAWRPPTDVYETSEAIIVQVEIAGMRSEDFNIALEKRRLTIRGNRQDTSELRAYHQMEIPFGEFLTQIELPVAVDGDRVEAEYLDGFLRLTLPKAQPEVIEVNEETED